MKKKAEHAQNSQSEKKDMNKEEQLEEIVIEHNVELEELKRQSKEYFELAQRTMADFDNYKKRTIKEKELLYADAVNSVVIKVLPSVDSLENAFKHMQDTQDNKSMLDGIEMVIRQFKDALKNIGVEEIPSVGEKFDPSYHYAVMHVTDEKYGENEIIEELQRGYVINDKVIRHSMVKVAN